MALCDDACFPVFSSWVYRLILINGELAVEFYDRPRKHQRPNVTCLYPGTNCSWYLLGKMWGSKGKFVHALLYKKRPYRKIKNPCPITPCNYDVSSNLTSGTETFLVDGSWTAPAGVVVVVVQAWGGGASGTAGIASSGGGGGGGGGYVKIRIGVVPGDAYTVDVGAGGIASGNDGAASTFWNATTVKAAGGDAGAGPVTGGAGGQVLDSVGCDIYRGGNGQDADLDGNGGGGGSSGGSAAPGLDGSGTPPTDAGQGGAAGVVGPPTTAGSAGTVPGGGGGGGGNTEAGGAGAAGKVILTW